MKSKHYRYRTVAMYSRNLNIPSFFSGFVKIKIESKFAGKFEPEALNEGFSRIEAKYTAAFESVFQKLGPYLYTNVFKVRYRWIVVDWSKVPSSVFLKLDTYGPSSNDLFAFLD